MVPQINYIQLDLMNHDLDTKVGNSALKKRLRLKSTLKKGLKGDKSNQYVW